ncbi:MAG TPA: ABC transporter substrate-binding protein [Chloroflexota bacterium]|nr:ABC transporter substrate-binding protein [Chloroflexota bacterium]
MAVNSVRVRRRFVLGGLSSGVAAVLLAACSKPAATSAPTAAAPAVAAQPTPTAAMVIAAPTPVPAQAKPTVAATAQSAVAAPATVQPQATTASATNVKRGGSIKAAVQGDWATMDPPLAQVGWVDEDLVFDYLTQIVRNPATGIFEVKPSLAESWQIPDPNTVVFKLRQGVKFHDGSDFNAQVAQWNFERMITNPKSTAKTETASIKSVDVVDDYTLKLNLKFPSPAIFVSLTSDAFGVAAMTSQEHWKKVGDAGVAREPVGTGPFKFVEWKPSDHTLYKSSGMYWKNGVDGKPLPYLDQVQVNFQPDWTVTLDGLRTGAIDLMAGIAGKDVPTVKNNSNLSYVEAPWQATLYNVLFNARPGARLAGDKMLKVRQAVLYAIDRQAIAKAIGLGIGSPNYYHLVPGQLGYNETVDHYTYQPDKAKQLLKESGQTLPFEITADFISRPEDQQNAQIYKDMLAKVGINLTLRPQERLAWVKRTLAGEFEFGTFLSGTFVDPDSTVEFRFGAKGPGNYAAWNNPQVQKLIDQGRSTYDTKERQGIYEQIDKLVFDDAYYGFIWRRSGNFAYTKALQNVDTPWSGYFMNSTPLWLNK